MDYCINEALSRNISVKQSRIDESLQQVSVKQQRGAYQPSISLSSGHNYTNTPFPATGYGYTNNVNGVQASSGVSHHSYSGNIGLSLNWTIWNGSRQPQIELARLNLKRSGLITNQTENNIREQVTEVYTQLMYATESVKVQQSLMESSEALRRQGEAKLNIGSLNKASYMQLVAACASDSSSLLQAESNVLTHQTTLLQLMELPVGQDFTLADIQDAEQTALGNIPALLEVYNDALANRPEIKAAEIDMETSQYDTRIAKAGYMPSFSLSAGTGTGWRSGSDFSFAEQMKNSWSNTAGINISVPIWNGRQTKSQVERAKIQEQSAELTYQNQVKTLRKAVETLWVNANTSQMQYIAAKSKLQATKAAYELMEEQFRIGQKTATDLLQERASLLSAEQQLLQAKYNAYYAQIMLQYYSQGL